MAYVTRTDANPGDLGSSADQNQAIDNEEALKTATASRQVTLIFDGAGSAPEVGAKLGFVWRGSGAWTITNWEVDAINGTAGTIEFDVWREASAVPLANDHDIVGGAGNHPALTAATRATAAPAAWTSVIIQPADVIVVNVNSAATCTLVALTLWGTMAV
jgi:hypothetical protein